MSKRKQAEAIIYKGVDEIDPSGTNSTMYKELFKNMSDKDFNKMMDAIVNDEYGIFIIAPNDHPDIKLDIDRNKEILDRRGVKLFNRLIVSEGDIEYSPTQEFMIIDLPVRRMIQTVAKKSIVREDIKSRNALTGQVAGKSNSGAITAPEISTLKSIGAKNFLKEIASARGGDVQTSGLLHSKLFLNGSASLKDVKLPGSRAKIIDSLVSIFKTISIRFKPKQ